MRKRRWLWSCVWATALVGILAACNTNSANTVSSKASSSSLPVVESVVSTKDEKEKPTWQTENLQTLPLSTSPLTGVGLPEGYVQGQRPVAIMVSANPKALPQKGVASADLVYEMLADNSYTNLMVVYTDYRSVPEVGPISSITDSFAQMALPQNYILAYINGSTYANNLLYTQNYKTIDGINIGTTAFKFDQSRLVTQYANRGSEYCWFTDAGLLWNGMERLDIHTSGEEKAAFRFASAPLQKQTDAYGIRIVYSPLTNSSFDYDETTGLYLKNRLDAPHADVDGTRLMYSNVLVLKMETNTKADSTLIDFSFTSGKGYYFAAGGVQEIQWAKGEPQEPLRFADMQGNVLELQQGKTFIGFVPENAEYETITYSAKPAPAPETEPEQPPQEQETTSINSQVQEEPPAE